MNRSELIAAIALILFGTFVLGWLAGWIVQRLSRPRRADMGELDRLAQQLLEAEEQRDQAIAARQAREAALIAQLATAEADSSAAMAALRDSRNEVEELRDYIEQRLARR